ncbi:MAG: efflux RND transporter periplasmic adaptor subunit [Oscillospiraceae bacterium]|nr:efflux RND transporter periplasmic adaptor subunit [Oscillospiraceae bacterium]
MNKRFFLVSLSIFSLCAALCTPKLYISTLPSAYTTQMKQIKYTEYVNAVGEIVSADSIDVTTELPVVIGSVHKQTGDAVSKGELLAEIDKEKSAKNIIELGEYASLANIADFSTSPDYVNIIQTIPQAIYSEFDGIVSSVSASNGGFIAAGGTVMTISGTQPLSVKANINENRISKVNTGQKVIISAGAFGDRIYEGYVESIADSATKEYSAASSQTVVEVNIVIENADEYVKSGYTADVKICVSEERELNIVPYEAVTNSGKSSFVYVFSDGTAKRKQITTGTETTEGIEVTSGIASDDILIYSDEELTNGGYVAIKTIE